MERAAKIRKRSVAEYEFRMAAGARLTTVWKKHRERNSDSTERAPAPTAPEKHHEEDVLEPRQVLIKPGDIRPISGTKEKTLRALAIHVVENKLAGPYAGIDPEEVNAMGKPGEMIPVRVEFALGREVIPAVHNTASAYPLKRVYKAQRAKGDLSKQLYVRMKLPSDVTSVGPVPELVMEVPEEEWSSAPAKVQQSMVMQGAESPPKPTRSTTTGIPPKRIRREVLRVSNGEGKVEVLTLWHGVGMKRIWKTGRKQRKQPPNNAQKTMHYWQSTRNKLRTTRMSKAVYCREPHRSHICIQPLNTRKRQYTRPKLRDAELVNIINKHNNGATEAMYEGARGERERKSDRGRSTSRGEKNRSTDTVNIGEHLFAENTGEHLFAKPENWDSKEVEVERTWGYKGMRVGEVSHLGPVAEGIH